MSISDEEDNRSTDIVDGVNGLQKVVLHQRHGSSVEVYLYGGQVTSWKNEKGEEFLFMSSKATFKPPMPIRGGIPICFTQLSNVGSLELHGFTGNRMWNVDYYPPPVPVNYSNRVFADLIFKSTEEDFKIWPHRFEYQLRVSLGPQGDLMLTSHVRNTSTKPFSFTVAYNTYFSVSDISNIRIEGLETLDYLDNLQKRQRFTEQLDTITFDSEVDKIYLSTPTKISIVDHGKERTFVIVKDGLPDLVVRNPWDKKTKAMPDFEDDDYKHMICVAAAALENPVTLNPGEEWKGSQEILEFPSRILQFED